MVEEQEEEEKVKCSRSRLIINLDVAGRRRLFEIFYILRIMVIISGQLLARTRNTARGRRLFDYV